MTSGFHVYAYVLRDANDGEFSLRPGRRISCMLLLMALGPKKSQLRSDRAKSVCGIDEIEEKDPGTGSPTQTAGTSRQRSFRIVRSTSDVHALDDSDGLLDLNLSLNASSKRFPSTVCLKELVSRAQARTGAKLSLCLEYG
ncbi:MAG: hypothetical protein GY696_38835 [Gammaproteobacteria bacterium]|nr:hypothetical protein [Gammaproteobacteria bacterium]